MKSIKKFSNSQTRLNEVKGGASNDYWGKTTGGKHGDERLRTGVDSAEEDDHLSSRNDGPRYFCAQP